MFARPLLILAAFFWTLSSWSTSFLKGSAQNWTECSSWGLASAKWSSRITSCISYKPLLFTHPSRTLAFFAVLWHCWLSFSCYPLKLPEPFPWTCYLLIPQLRLGSTLALTSGRTLLPTSFISDDTLTTHGLTHLHKKHESSCSYYGKVLKCSAIHFKTNKPRKTHSGKNLFFIMQH